MMSKIVEFPKKIKHSKESKKFASILNEHWSDEFDERGNPIKESGEAT